MENEEFDTFMASLSGSSEEPKKEEVVEEPKKEEPEKEEPKEEQVQEEEKGEEKVVEEPVVEPKVEEPPAEDKDAIIADLRSKLAEATKPVEKVEDKKEEPKEEPLTLSDQNFVDGVDLDEITRDPKELNKVFNKIYQQAVTDTRKILGEGILKAIPDIVRKNVEVVNDLKRMHDEFYSANEDLAPFKKVVAVVFEEIASQNQGKTYDDLLKLTAPEVRKRLNLQNKVVSIDKKKADPPKLPSKGAKAGSVSDNKPQTDALQAEIEAMEKSLGR